MTDEERQQSECVICRNSFQSDGGFICDKCRAGIDKPALAQSDAEPVVQTEFELEDGLHELAFPAPSRPDASAGLIEAAEITREWAGATSSLVEAHLLDALARELRARAADRSGK